MLAMVMPIHAGDDAAVAIWLRRYVYAKSCWRQCCRVMPVTALPGRLGRGAIYMSSHAGDDATEATWPWRCRRP
jgi:hypothetical protein